MTNKKSSGKLFIYGVLIVLLLFGFIKIIANIQGNYFKLELFGFLFLLLLSLIGLTNYIKNWGERLLFFVFLFYLLNLTLIWYFQNLIYLILMFLTLIGFLMSFPKKIEKKHSFKEKSIPKEEIHSEIFEPLFPVKEEKVKINNKDYSKNKSHSSNSKIVKHSPGKYIASKRSNIYHEPKCEWGKKISATRRVWFKNKNEAWEKGYKAHSCVN